MGATNIFKDGVNEINRFGIKVVRENTGFLLYENGFIRHLSHEQLHIYMRKIAKLNK